MSKDKQKYGQYMTPDLITDFMVSMSNQNLDCRVLEPSCGEGAFLASLTKAGFTNIDAYEIDDTIIPDGYFVRNCSFISASFDCKYDLIIGNPPYIRWKNLEQSLKEEVQQCDLWQKYCNSLCDYSSVFIVKSIDLLKDGGELIFITPEYWLSTTHSEKMRKYMLEQGYISDIVHFNETPIFDGANVSLIIFKFVKGKSESCDIRVTKYYSHQKINEDAIKSIKSGNGKNVSTFYVPQFSSSECWILAGSDVMKMIDSLERSCSSDSGCNRIGQYFNIGNGMVSGLDKAFQIPSNTQLNSDELNNTINVIKAKDLSRFSYEKITRYIFIKDAITEDDFISRFPNFNFLLLPYKEQLAARYNYGRDIKFWEWVFLRNYKLFSGSVDRIFVPCKERITNKTRMRFSYIPAGYFPTQDVTAIFKKDNLREDLLYVVAFLNSKYVFNWLLYKGIRKGDIVEFSEKPITMIPYRAIDFNDDDEKHIYFDIIQIMKTYISSKDDMLLEKIDYCFDLLLGV